MTPHPRHRTLPMAGAFAGLLAAAVLPACGDDKPTENTEPLTISTTDLEDGAEGVHYEAMLAATGGTGMDYQWSLTGRRPGGLYLRSEGTPGTALTGVPTTGGTFSFTVRVADSDGNVATADFTVDVSAAPDGLAITTEMLENPVRNEAYSATIEATNGTVDKWSVASGELPPGLTLAAGSGTSTELSGTPTQTGRYSFTIRAQTENGAQRASKQFSVEVQPDGRMLAITDVNLPTAQATIAYDFDLVSEDGVGELQWSVTVGTLPPGLMLAPTGNPTAAISGIPTQEGSWSFRVQVRDADGQVARRAFFMVVEEAPPALRISTFQVPSGVQGVPYSETIATTGGLQNTITWSVINGSLPTGVSLTGNGASASLAGTPTESGRFPFEVQAQDATGKDATQRFSLLIEPEVMPLAITATTAVGGVLPLEDATVGEAYTDTIEATGGAHLPLDAGQSERRYQWVVDGGALPPGLSLQIPGDAVTGRGVVSGTPTQAGTFTATVTVYDRENATASQAVSIVVSE